MHRNRLCLAILFFFSGAGAAQSASSAIPSQIAGHDAIVAGSAWYRAVAGS